jgi:hypothetical protein
MADFLGCLECFCQAFNQMIQLCGVSSQYKNGTVELCLGDLSECQGIFTSFDSPLA